MCRSWRHRNRRRGNSDTVQQRPRIYSTPPLPRLAAELEKSTRWRQEVLPTLMRSRLASWGQPGYETNSQQDCPLYNGRIPLEITMLIFEYALSPKATSIQVGGLETEKPHEFRVRFDHEREDDEHRCRGSDQWRGGYEDAQEAAPPPNNAAHTPPHRTSAICLSPAQIRRLRPFELREAMGFDWYRPETGSEIVFPGWTLLQTCRRVYLDVVHLHARNREIIIIHGMWSRNKQLYHTFPGGSIQHSRGPYFEGIPPSSMRWYTEMYWLVSVLCFR